jgi:hypothetical protein
MRDYTLFLATLSPPTELVPFLPGIGFAPLLPSLEWSHRSADPVVASGCDPGLTDGILLNLSGIFFC